MIIYSLSAKFHKWTRTSKRVWSDSVGYNQIERERVSVTAPVTSRRYRGAAIALSHSFPGQANRIVRLVSDFQHANLPGRSAMIDREDDLAALLAGLEAEWFVTIVGSGGRRQYSPLCCLALNRISRLQTARLRADEPHFPAVAQTVGFGLGRSKILYFSRWID
jgi:hypothetical protein